ncbi:MAG: oligoribonuclease, partial [Marmoricola sp.]
MTGLDLRADALVEVAALVTDFELNVLGDGVDVVIKPPDEALAQMVPFVREMHTSSGLLEELAAGMSLEDAQAQVLSYVSEHCAPGSRPPLAGNTVATDRAFIDRDLVELGLFLHYRIV